MHFGKNLTETGFPELIPEIFSDSSNFISTPTKLNPGGACPATAGSEEGREFAERLKGKNPDILVVIAYGKIIPQAILDIPNIAPINVHGSLLPKNPHFADHLIRTALKNRYHIDFPLEPLPDELEIRAHEVAIERAKTAKTLSL